MTTSVLQITNPLSGVEVWTVDRPHARNAIDPAVADALGVALGRAEADPTLRALVLTGAGPSVFVSGADLKFLRDAPDALRAAQDARMVSVLERLANLPVPVIGALNGAVIGGGVEVALACDIRIAEPHATLTVKHAAMGISPGWGGFRRLIATVGRSTAAKLLLTATPMAAADALRVGLFDELAPPGGAVARALELASAVLLTSPSAVAETKQLLTKGYGAGLSLDDEQALFLERTMSADHREALAAFAEKRAPAYAPRGAG